MLRPLKFCAFLLINLAVALIGTAILDTAVWRIIPSHSLSAIVWKEIVFSICFAVLIGFAMWRTWQNFAAMWIWIPAAIWFAFGYVTLAGSNNVWGQLSGLGSRSVLAPPDVRSFFSFTVPLIRAISYSAGAYISSLVYRAPMAST